MEGRKFRISKIYLLSAGACAAVDPSISLLRFRMIMNPKNEVRYIRPGCFFPPRSYQACTRCPFHRGSPEGSSIWLLGLEITDPDGHRFEVSLDLIRNVDFQTEMNQTTFGAVKEGQVEYQEIQEWHQGLGSSRLSVHPIAGNCIASYDMCMPLICTIENAYSSLV